MKTLPYILILGLSPFAGSLFAETTSVDTDYFEKHIRPILVQRCYECHSKDAKKLKGDLYLDSKAGWQHGGSSGPVIVSGNPEASLLVKAIRYDDTDLQMPPKSKLSAAEITHLETWIKGGAPDPREGGAVMAHKEEMDIEEGRTFWAFQAPVKPSVPKVKQAAWPKSDIDRFILARLEAQGITPGKASNAYALVRRVHYDLTGLPPTPEDIESYIEDTGPNALAKHIDQLLDSKAFGERWGRHWLDVARYAESSGGGRSLMFKDAWRYRDYVIAAFNKDKPYDEFIKEQLAGDLLPHASSAEQGEHFTATGYLALGPTNYELQDKALLQMEVIDEQLDTLGRTFMGMTIGCARCHDHKFDPIPTRDYYALAGILKSTQTLTPGNVSSFVMQELPLEGDARIEEETRSRKIEDLTAQYELAKKALDALGGEPKKPAPKRGERQYPSSELRGIVVDDVDAIKNGFWKKSTSNPKYVDAGYIHDDHADKGQKSVVFTPKILQGGMYEVRMAYAAGVNRPENVPVDIDHADGRTTQLVNQSKTPPIDGLFISLGTYRFEANVLTSVTVRNDSAAGAVIADTVQWIRVEDLTGSKSSLKQPGEVATPQVAQSPTPPVDSEEKAKQREVADQKVKELSKALKELKKKSADVRAKVMAVKDETKPEDGHIHIKGGVRNLGDKVPRGFLQVMMRAEEQAAIPEAQSGRLELANWIARDTHPLTARVMVNRVWHHLLGVGLVRTTDNFGKTGEMPSHPELLDYLAIRFMEEGWSVKTLIRNIMLSQVYQLSTEERADARTADVENRLLWRANRRQLDAEALRDSILTISGLLEPIDGGLTIEKFNAYDNGYKHTNPKMRSVYVPAFRAAQLDFFAVFDAANPNLVTGRRPVSTLPTQSLFLMNSPFVMENSEAAARRLLGDDAAMDNRMERVYREVLGRSPTSKEFNLAESYLHGHDMETKQGKLAAWSRMYHALFASVDFRYLN